jgi:hypothetical protein
MYADCTRRCGGLVGVSGVVVDDLGTDAGGVLYIPYSVMERLAGRRMLSPSLSLLAIIEVLCGRQPRRAATRCINAAPADVDLCGVALTTSTRGEGACGAAGPGPLVRARQSLPTAVRAPWPGSGAQCMAGRFGSGVSEADLARPCDALWEVAPAVMLSLYLKCGERPSRSATQMPVTWTSLFTSSSTGWVVRSGEGSSSIESCSPNNGRMCVVGGCLLADCETDV